MTDVERIEELIKEGQAFGEAIAVFLDPILISKAEEIGNEDAGIVLRIATLHACATILVNGYDKSVTSEQRISNAKMLVDTYFKGLNADNITIKE